MVSGVRGSICAPAAGETIRTTGTIASVIVMARLTTPPELPAASNASALKVKVPAAVPAGTGNGEARIDARDRRNDLPRLGRRHDAARREHDALNRRVVGRAHGEGDRLTGRRLRSGCRREDGRDRRRRVADGQDDRALVAQVAAVVARACANGDGASRWPPRPGSRTRTSPGRTSTGGATGVVPLVTSAPSVWNTMLGDAHVVADRRAQCHGLTGDDLRRPADRLRELESVGAHGVGHDHRASELDGVAGLVGRRHEQRDAGRRLERRRNIDDEGLTRCRRRRLHGAALAAGKRRRADQRDRRQRPRRRWRRRRPSAAVRG